MKLDISQFPPLKDARLVPHEELRLSDSSRIYYELKQLMRNGERLELEMAYNIEIPTVKIRPPQNTERSFTQNMFLYLTPEIDEFIMNYLLTGKCDSSPSYTVPKTYTYKSDYGLYHLKHEQKRGVTRVKKMEQEGRNGYLYYAEYPYGIIEYGFYPFSPQCMKLLLANLETI